VGRAASWVPSHFWDWPGRFYFRVRAQLIQLMRAAASITPARKFHELVVVGGDPASAIISRRVRTWRGMARSATLVPCRRRAWAHGQAQLMHALSRKRRSGRQAPGRSAHGSNAPSRRECRRQRVIWRKWDDVVTSASTTSAATFRSRGTCFDLGIEIAPR
jgi:hypothetical protein